MSCVVLCCNMWYCTAHRNTWSCIVWCLAHFNAWCCILKKILFTALCCAGLQCVVFYCVVVYCTTICVKNFSWGLPVFWDRPEHRGPFWRPQPSPCEPCLNADKVLFCITYCMRCVALWSAKAATHCEDFVAGDHHQDRHGLVHQGQRSMLQFSCQDALWVHVGQLLDFLLTRKRLQVFLQDAFRLILHFIYWLPSNAGIQYNLQSTQVHLSHQGAPSSCS